jgi:uncharacterized DUF497 family protein
VREIRWTERNEDHIARHDVLPAEVEQVVYTRPRLVIAGREETTLVFGTTDGGRHLVVVLADAEDGRHFVVTARDMSEGERRAFVRRSR